MRRSASSAFVNQLVVYATAALVFTGSIGFGTVWLRHEVSVAANRNKNLQGRIAEVQRRLDQLTAEIAAAKTPDNLIRLDSSMRLGLDMPRQEQVEHVSENVDLWLASRSGGELLNAGARPVLFRLPGGAP